MNIVLAIIDTLRYDFIGANGNGWIRTPNLDELVRRGWSFDRAFASSFPTIPHRTDVMTGRRGGPFHPWRPLAFDAVTLPRLLAQAGYCTQLIHDTPHLVNGGHAFDWPFHAWRFIRGAEVDRPAIDDQPLTYLANWKPDPLFDFVGDEQVRQVTDHTLVTYVRANRKRRNDEDWNAARLFLSAAEFLRDNARRDNFFLWVDCFDPHEPWDAPPEFVRMYDDTPGYDGTIDPRAFLGRRGKEVPPAVEKRLKAMYSGKVSWVDRWFGEFLRALDETHLARNTAVILTADHGTNVGERGKFGKQWVLHEQEAHVPLVVCVPGRGQGRSDAIVQPQDISATILGIAGVEKPVAFDGCDVLRLLEEGKPSPREVALAGPATCHWRGDPSAVVCSVFDRADYLQWAPRRRDCRLFRYGALEPISSLPRAEEMYRLGVDALRRSGTHPELMDWLAGEGASAFPAHCCPPAEPAGWQHYYQRLYNRW